MLVDKPVGWTSFDVVAKVRSELRRRQSLDLSSQKDPLSSKNSGLRSKLKVGHAGTLDPFATGLLIILVGDACKQADKFLKLDKTYEFTAKLGETSTTGDPEGEKTKSGDRGVEIEEIEAVLKKFTGEIMQTPPAFSAIKIDGKRAYKLAREGKKVEIPPRQVTVSKLQITEYSYPYVKCVCDVSSGTYIRSLVEDIGKALKTGAYCSDLRRTRIGTYSIDDAKQITDIVGAS